MSDLLRMDYINSLPQPFIAKLYNGSCWPVIDIDVQSGLMRIDVVGMVDVLSIGDVKTFFDADGAEHDPESFYSDYEMEREITND